MKTAELIKEYEYSPRLGVKLKLHPSLSLYTLNDHFYKFSSEIEEDTEHWKIFDSNDKFIFKESTIVPFGDLKKFVDLYSCISIPAEILENVNEIILDIMFENDGLVRISFTKECIFKEQCMYYEC